MRTLAVLPVKRFGLAKQRLADGLDARAREALAEAMVLDVLGALAAVRGLLGLVVVSAEPRAVEAARRAGAELVADLSEAGQSPAAAAGVARARELGAERVLLVPGDCPALEPGEVEELLEAGGPPPAVTVVPDRHGTGTNALLVAPADAIAPAFGPGSFARHVASARAVGGEPQVARPASLLLDVDTAGDLDALRTVLDARPHGAAHTREALRAAPARSSA